MSFHAHADVGLFADHARLRICRRYTGRGRLRRANRFAATLAGAVLALPAAFWAACVTGGAAFSSGGKGPSRQPATNTNQIEEAQ